MITTQMWDRREWEELRVAERDREAVALEERQVPAAEEDRDEEHRARGDHPMYSAK